VSARNVRRRRSPARVWTMIAGAAAAVVFGGALVLDLPVYPAWVVSLSIVLFAVYGLDKRRAKTGGGRVPEVVLHGVALAGGFPGGWAGRSAFRHKTRHLSFLVVLVVATMLHVGIVLWLIR
jgi:uncharacterized membrane protein YsdA (DUF1294 family)